MKVDLALCTLQQGVNDQNLNSVRKMVLNVHIKTCVPIYIYER
jgi:hypothetical protein